MKMFFVLYSNIKMVSFLIIFTNIKTLFLYDSLIYKTIFYIVYCKIFFFFLKNFFFSFQDSLSSQAALQVMFGCQYVRLNELPVSTFCAVFHALCDVLFSLLLDFNRAVLATLPSFIGVLKHILLFIYFCMMLFFFLFNDSHYMHIF